VTAAVQYFKKCAAYLHVCIVYLYIFERRIAIMYVQGDWYLPLQWRDLGNILRVNMELDVTHYLSGQMFGVPKLSLFLENMRFCL
jgi:hypothetical protein